MRPHEDITNKRRGWELTNRDWFIHMNVWEELQIKLTKVSHNNWYVCTTMKDLCITLHNTTWFLFLLKLTLILLHVTKVFSAVYSALVKSYFSFPADISAAQQILMGPLCHPFPGLDFDLQINLKSAIFQKGMQIGWFWATFVARNYCYVRHTGRISKITCGG